MRRLRGTVDRFDWSDAVQCNANDRDAWTELKWTHASGIYLAAEIKRQGLIIVNEVNRRYFEPAARSWLAGTCLTVGW